MSERTIDRQSWWIEFGAWSSGQRDGPLCVECAETIPIERVVFGPEVLLCEECESLAPASGTKGKP